MDNRLIANAVRLRIEPLFCMRISPEQRGSVSGISMLANVIDVDESMQKVSLMSEHGIAVFLDFAAAFPSLSHQFIVQVLDELELPAGLRNYIKALYFNNVCVMKVGGKLHEGLRIYMYIHICMIQ